MKACTHSTGGRARRLCDVTTVRIRPAVWNTPPDPARRAETLTWLAERKTLSKVRVSYHDVTADDLTLLGTLPALAVLELDQIPQSDEVWSAVGRLERVRELSLGKPTYRQRNRRSAQSDWADENPAEDGQMQREIDDAARFAPPSTDTVRAAPRPPRLGRRQLKLMHGLPNVRRLALALLTIEDDPLSQLTSLETLKLSRCVARPEAYLSLADCRLLKELELEKMHPGKFGAAGVAAIPGLRSLKLDGPVTNDEFQAICANRTITDLELTDVSRLSPECLARLTAVLWRGRTDQNPAGCERFGRAIAGSPGTSLDAARLDRRSLGYGRDTLAGARSPRSIGPTFDRGSAVQATRDTAVGPSRAPCYVTRAVGRVRVVIVFAAVAD